MEIGIFCVFFSNIVKDIIKKIIDKLDDILDECMLFIDVLWKFIKGFKSGVDKNIIIEVMKILSCILVLFVLVFFMCGVVLYVVFLVVYFLKVIFYFINLKNMLDFKVKLFYDIFWYDLVGLVEKLEKIVIFIDVVDDEEYVDEFML